MNTTLLLLGTLLLLIVLGIPIGFSIELTGAIFLLTTGMKPLIMIAQRTIAGMDNYALMAIPLFTLAGYLMDSGGLSKRLVDWVNKFFGWLPGGMGTVTVVCCTIFAALTGSGPATVAAIGAIMVPSMLENGYSKAEAGGLLAAGGALGPIIPPSIAMIIYGSTMSVSIPDMFLGGIFPGILIAIFLIITNVILSKKRETRLGIRKEREKYTGKELWDSTVHAIGVLFLPVIILGGIYGGIFTPTEAATVAVVYSIVLGFLYRELTMPRLIQTAVRTVETSAMVVFIAGISAVLSWLLASTRIPATIANALLPYISNQVTYFLFPMLILFFVGCIMDATPSMLILAPILVPIGIELGVDPLHLGLCFCIYLVLGYLTPPFGLNLFAAANATDTTYMNVVKGVLPYILAMFLAILLITFIPQISLFLPNLK